MQPVSLPSLAIRCARDSADWIPLNQYCCRLGLSLLPRCSIQWVDDVGEEPQKRIGLRDVPLGLNRGRRHREPRRGTERAMSTPRRRPARALPARSRGSISGATRPAGTGLGASANRTADPPERWPVRSPDLLDAHGRPRNLTEFQSWPLLYDLGWPSDWSRWLASQGDPPPDLRRASDLRLCSVRLYGWLREGTVRRSKGDWDGAVATHFCREGRGGGFEAIHRLDALPQGRVFGLRSDRAVSNRIALAGKAVGLVDRFWGHSPRVGLACDVMASGEGLRCRPDSREAGAPRRCRPTTHAGELASKGAVARFHRED